MKTLIISLVLALGLAGSGARPSGSDAFSGAGDTTYETAHELAHVQQTR